MVELVGIALGQYPGGASLPLGPLLLCNYDDILEVVSIGTLGLPGLTVPAPGIEPGPHSPKYFV